jgi:hypothetical protein
VEVHNVTVDLEAVGHFGCRCFHGGRLGGKVRWGGGRGGGGREGGR